MNKSVEASPDISLREDEDRIRLEERFHLLADNLPESFWLIDVEERRVIYVNPAYERAWGGTREALLRDRHSWLTHLLPEDAQRIRAAMRVHRYGGLDEQVRIRRPDGQLRWMHIRSFAIGAGSRPHSVGGIAFDITPLVEQQTALENEKEAQKAASGQLRNVIDALSAHVAIVDAKGAIVDVNDQWRRLDAACGDGGPDYVGQDYATVCRAVLGMDEGVTGEADEGLRSVLSGQRNQFSLTYATSGADQPRWFRIVVAPLAGTVQGAVVMHLDISESIQAEAQIHRLAHFDALTGLANRKLLTQRLSEWLWHGERQHHRVAILEIALNRFKNINDTWGYEAGDSVLTTIGKRLHTALRPSDVLGRLGGDVFAAVLSETEEAMDISLVAHRLMDAVAAPTPLGNETVHLTASIGIAIYPDDGRDAQALLQGAESALFRAKKKGRNGIEFYEEGLNAVMRMRQRLELELRRAVAEEQFVAHFQPKVSSRTGTIVGMEALLRWQHPERGLLAPGEFIPLLEDTDLIVEVGEWMLKTVGEQLLRWRGEGLPIVPVAVNLSARQLSGDRLYRYVRQLVEQTGLPTSYIELELTESMLMEHVEETIANLSAFKALGVRLSIDDFGTGYSSLSYLKRFPLDTLKVNQTFLKDITSSVNDASIVRAIITMAHALNLSVIAVGVETEGQCGTLIANHCDEIQGHYFSPPLPADEMGHLLRERRTLPEYVLRSGPHQRTLLVVDDEENIVAAIKRLLRREGYAVLTANGGEAGLEMLAKHRVDVIVSDQRMPGMTGVEFLRRAKELHPETVRMVLSGYTELQSVTSAINEGAIYKFLTKPWDDEQFKADIGEAFRRKELIDDNWLLTEEIKIANRHLAEANAKLEAMVREKQRQIGRDETAMGVLQEIVASTPWALVGVDGSGMIVLANAEAEALFGQSSSPLGRQISEIASPDVVQAAGDAAPPARTVVLNGAPYRMTCRTLGLASAGSGKVLSFLPEAGYG